MKTDIFEVLVDDQEAPSTRPRQWVSIHGSDALVWQAPVLRRGSLRDGEPSFQELECRPPPLFDVVQIERSVTGARVALIGARGIRVAEVPQQTAASRRSTNACTTRGVAESLFRRVPSLTIVQARWHPLSATDSHLVVLTNDNVLRLFNVAPPASAAPRTFKAESAAAASPLSLSALSSTSSGEEATVVLGTGASSFNLSVMGASRLPTIPISFDFAGSSGWHTFGIVVLLDNGDVQTVSPLIPKKSVLPRKLLKDLMEHTRTQCREIEEDVLNDMADAQTHQEWQMRMRWLQGLAESVRGGMGSGARSLSEESAFVVVTAPRTFERRPVSIQGPYEVLEREVEESEGDEAEEESALVDDACAVVVVESAPLTIVSARASGRVTVMLHLCDLLPKWEHNKGSSASQGASCAAGEPMMLTQLHVYERIDLCLPPLKSSGSTADEYNDDEDKSALWCGGAVTLHVDPLMPSRILCAHRAGVHSITLTWLTQMSQFLTAASSDSTYNYSTTNIHDDDSGGGAPELSAIIDLKPALVMDLLQTMPLSHCEPSPVYGLGIVSDHRCGYSAVAVSAQLQSVVLPLSLTTPNSCAGSNGSASLPLFASHQKNTMTDSNNDINKDSDNHEQRFDMRIRDILSATESSAVPHIASKTKSVLPDCAGEESLQLLLNATAMLRESHIVSCRKAFSEIKSRIGYNERLQLQQEREVDELKTTVRGVRNALDETTEVVAQVRTRQSRLTEQLDLILQLLHQHQPVLSDNERRFHAEIDAAHKAVKELHTRMAEVRVKTDEDLILSRELQLQQQQQRTPSDQMMSDHLIKLHPMLEAENDSLTRLTDTLMSLQLSADDAGV